MNAPVTVHELRQAKKRMQTAKAVGCDMTPIEFILGMRKEGQRYGVSALDEHVVSLLNSILASGKYPKAWQIAMLVALAKGGVADTTDPNNYRGIALLNAISKLFATILEIRLTEYLWQTKQVAAEQFGFTRGRRTLDPCFILDTLIDDAKKRKKPLYVCFIDFSKAYDFIDRSALFYKMIAQGVVGPMLRVMQSMYEAVKSIVRVGHDTSEVIEQMVGVKQGCVLSPCLFSLYISDLPAWLAQYGCRGVGLHDTWVRVLLYADDGALLADTPEDLQQMLNALKLYCAR